MSENTERSLQPPPPTVAPPASIPEAGSTQRSMAIEWQCVRCGSTDLAAGYAVDWDGSRFRQFRLAPRALRLSKIARMLRPFRQLLPISAQVCRNCGAVMFEVDPDQLLDAEKRYGRR